jgi:hypothetical protein
MRRRWFLARSGSAGAVLAPGVERGGSRGEMPGVGDILIV